MKRVLARLELPLRVGVIAGVAWLVWHLVSEVLATNALAVPAALAFALFAWLAGRPYLVRPPTRWSRRTVRIPRDVRKKMRYFGRIVLWRVEKIELPGKRFAFFRTLSLFCAVSIVAGSGLLHVLRQRFVEGLPNDLSSALTYHPTIATHVYSSDGELICTFSTENRVRVPLESIPEHVRNAFIAAEDQEFYSHRGFDLTAIARAALANAESGETRQGGSTITQQVVKLVIIRNSERTYRRKIQEIFLAVEIERRLPKDRILEIYLNHIFLGHGAYGVEAAARTYFGKSADQLTLAEAAMLAGLPRAPSRDSPYAHYDRARRRMSYVLDRMVELGFVTRAQADDALREEIAIITQEDPLNHTAAPYFCDLVRRELKRMYGNRAVFEEGLTVRTTLDMRMQRAAEFAVRHGLLDLERRLGWNGPEGHDEAFSACDGPPESVADGAREMARVTAVGASFSVCIRGNVFPVLPDDVTRMRAWERGSRRTVAVGDLMSVIVRTVTTGAPGRETSTRYAVTARRTGGADNPEALQAALVSVDPETGELRALVGGYDFVENQFNNATMGLRQPGSSIKPYVYLSALRRGMTVDERVNDHPVCYTGSNGLPWCPTNYTGPHTVNPYRGWVDLRTALAQSLNSVSVQLAARTGVEEVIRTMRALGITSPLQRYLPLAVGSAEVSPWEHTFAYASIAAGGRVLPRHPGATSAGIFITSVEDAGGRVLYRYERRPREEWPLAWEGADADAYALTWLMRGVIDQGTGRRVRELRRPAAGKTGTTNDFRDVWFMGFTADLVTGVWVGRNRPVPIAREATGGSIALPIWLSYMEAAHPETPPRDFEAPADVSLVYDARFGGLVPYQRGRMPASSLGSASSASFSGESPF